MRDIGVSSSGPLAPVSQSLQNRQSRPRPTTLKPAGSSSKPESTHSTDGPIAQAGIGHEVDIEVEYEFGGPWGVLAIMIGFPVLMYYMFIGAFFYDGRLPTPSSGQTWADFAVELAGMAYEHAYPHRRAWATYWSFFIFEIVCYLFLPGIEVIGKKLPHQGNKSLKYYCSGMWSLYTTLAVVATLNLTGLFRLSSIIDDFGSLMSVAILSGFGMAAAAYVSAFTRGATHRMTGNHVYDFFMGAELNPRLFGRLDFKMFYEVRIPWYVLLLVSCATACRQWERYGAVSPEVGFLVMAHYLYANACAKGEDLIVTTWDMYYEKLGFMLTFWNLAGVPLTYCHASIYLALHEPASYQLRTWMPKTAAIRYGYIAAFYGAYLFVYWVWDTANSQKNRFRAKEAGRKSTDRNTFPQLPWRDIENPRVIETGQQNRLLADGVYGLARKVHYGCDAYFALSWAVITGVKSPFPWFYPVFFVSMIIHRASRDIARCRRKYGAAWLEYERLVPALFVPFSWSQIVTTVGCVGGVLATVNWAGL